MSKITVSRIFEISKLLKTKAGQELNDGLVYLAEFAEVSLRSLRNGLTFEDNFDCELKTISVINNTETSFVASAKNIKKRVREIRLRKSPTEKYYCIDSYGWKYASNGDLLVKVKFTDFAAGDAGLAFPIDLILYF